MAKNACPIMQQEPYETTVLFNAIINQFYSPTAQSKFLVERFLAALNNTTKESTRLATISKSKNLLHITNDIAHIAQTFGKTIETLIKQNNYITDEIVATLTQLVKECNANSEKIAEESDLFKKIVASKNSTLELTTLLISMIEQTIQILQPSNHEIHKIITNVLPTVLSSIKTYTIAGEKFDPIVKNQWERFVMILNTYIQKHDPELMQYVNDVELIIQEIITRIDKTDAQISQLLAKLIILYKRIVVTSNQLNHYKNTQTTSYTFVRFTTTSIMNMVKKSIQEIKQNQK